MSKQTKRRADAGISLLEIMVVLAIIALIAGLSTPRIMQGFGRAKSTVAETQMTNVRGALQLYYIDVGRYPSEGEGLKALLVAPANLAGWDGPYIDQAEQIIDPWGREIVYRSPGSERAFELISYGRDGHPGGTKEDSDIIF